MLTWLCAAAVSAIATGIAVTAVAGPRVRELLYARLVIRRARSRRQYGRRDREPSPLAGC